MRVSSRTYPFVSRISHPTLPTAWSATSSSAVCTEPSTYRYPLNCPCRVPRLPQYLSALATPPLSKPPPTVHPLLAYRPLLTTRRLAQSNALAFSHIQTAWLDSTRLHLGLSKPAVPLQHSRLKGSRAKNCTLDTDHTARKEEDGTCCLGRLLQSTIFPSATTQSDFPVIIMRAAHDLHSVASTRF